MRRFRDRTHEVTTRELFCEHMMREGEEFLGPLGAETRIGGAEEKNSPRLLLTRWIQSSLFEIRVSKNDVGYIVV